MGFLAWQQAFGRALKTCNDIEVTRKEATRKKMAGLSGDELKRAKDMDREHQRKHKDRTDKIKHAREGFLLAMAITT